MLHTHLCTWMYIVYIYLYILPFFNYYLIDLFLYFSLLWHWQQRKNIIVQVIYFLTVHMTINTYYCTWEIVTFENKSRDKSHEHTLKIALYLQIIIIMIKIQTLFTGVLFCSRKHALNCHRMKPALFNVLCEIKEKTGKSSFFSSFKQQHEPHCRLVCYCREIS